MFKVRPLSPSLNEPIFRFKRLAPLSSPFSYDGRNKKNDSELSDAIESIKHGQEEWKEKNSVSNLYHHIQQN